MHNFLYFVTIVITISVSLDPEGENVCPRKISFNGTITIAVECCPDYRELNGTCTECEAGRFGDKCLLACIGNYYGIQCKTMCNCTANQICDPVRGCVCNPGLTGTGCSQECSPGSYGANCEKTCLCAQNAKCNRETGQCICPAGWYGQYCTGECPIGYFGEECKQKCDCPTNSDCSRVSGECKCHTGFTGPGCISSDVNKGKGDSSSPMSIVAYLIMAAGMTFLVCTVTLGVKAKQFICRSVKKTVRAERQLHVTPTRVEHQLQVTSLTPMSHSQSMQSVMCVPTTTTALPYNSVWEEENLYCEIDDVVNTY